MLSRLFNSKAKVAPLPAVSFESSKQGATRSSNSGELKVPMIKTGIKPSLTADSFIVIPGLISEAMTKRAVRTAFAAVENRSRSSSGSSSSDSGPRVSNSSPSNASTVTVAQVEFLQPYETEDEVKSYRGSSKANSEKNSLHDLIYQNATHAAKNPNRYEEAAEDLYDYERERIKESISDYLQKICSKNEYLKTNKTIPLVFFRKVEKVSIFDWLNAIDDGLVMQAEALNKSFSARYLVRMLVILDRFCGHDKTLVPLNVNRIIAASLALACDSGSVSQFVNFAKLGINHADLVAMKKAISEKKGMNLQVTLEDELNILRDLDHSDGISLRSDFRPRSV